MKSGTFEVVHVPSKYGYVWRLCGRAGNILAESRSYASKEYCLRALADAMHLYWPEAITQPVRHRRW